LANSKKLHFKSITFYWYDMSKGENFFLKKPEGGMQKRGGKCLGGPLYDRELGGGTN